MKNTFWNKIWKFIKDDLLFTILLILLSLPLLLVFIIIYGIFTLITAPFECSKYKKSIYYKTYKRKYSIGITHTERFHICTKLLENNVVLQELVKPYGYWCLANDKQLFAILADGYSVNVRINGREHDNPIIVKNHGHYSSNPMTLGEFISAEQMHFSEELKNKSLTIFVRANKVDPELKYILNNNNVVVHSNSDELVELIIRKVTQ